MSSWISTGENLPISADQIKDAFGSDKIKELASKLKIGEHDTSKSLTDMLPHLIIRLTPDGSVPQPARQPGHRYAQEEVAGRVSLA